MSQLETVAVIPAFNEENTVSRVIRAALRSEEVDAVYLVNDGSSDSTGEIAAQSSQVEGTTKPFTIIEQPFNKGKSEAIFTGVEAAYRDIGRASIRALLFIDADLSPTWSRSDPGNMKLTSRIMQLAGYRPQINVVTNDDIFIDTLAARIDQLIMPIIVHGKPMTIGMPQRNFFADNLRIGLNWGALGGCRGVSTEFFDNLREESTKRGVTITEWELEAALNTFSRKYRDENGLKLNKGIDKFLWDDVVNVGSRIKAGSFTNGLKRMLKVHSQALFGYAKYGYRL